MSAPPGTAEALAAVPGIVGPPAPPPGTAGARRREPAGGAGGVWPGEREPDPHASLPIRSAERRRWAADLTGPTLAGLVLYGVGGIGKSTLASQIVSRVSHLEPEWVTTVISGEVSADGLLAAVAAALRRHPAMSPGGSRADSVRAAGRTDLPWEHRLDLLREHVPGHLPVLVVLDNFDDNVSADGGGWKIRDPALAGLIASWAGATYRGKLLITCRHPFTQPAAGPPLGFRHIGPLSRSGAFELAKSLPALGRLGEQELDRAWRLLGGHPHAMKSLDSLLAASEASFPEVARRLARAIGAATGDTARPMRPAAPTELPPAAAGTIALAACDLLAGELRGQAPGDAAVNGAHRRHARAWRPRTTFAAAVAAVLVATAVGVGVAWHPRASTVRAGAAPPRPAAVLDHAAAIRSRTAAWVARQISRTAIDACDPDMCSALLAQGIAPGNLLELRAATPDPLGSDVVVATAAVRSQFGARLAGVYAPGILASFGSGGLRIDVRAIAPDGAAAYQAALASDVVARRDAGRQLLGNPHLRVSTTAAQAELRAGQVDPRLLTTLAVLAATGSVQVTAFGDSGPGAGDGVPLRSAEITGPPRAGPARLRDMIAFVRAQRPPYLPSRSLITPGAAGSPVLTIQFAAPSPAGLLQPEPAR